MEKPQEHRGCSHLPAARGWSREGLEAFVPWEGFGIPGEGKELRPALLLAAVSPSLWLPGSAPWKAQGAPKQFCDFAGRICEWEMFLGLVTGTLRSLTAWALCIPLASRYIFPFF